MAGDTARRDAERSLSLPYTTELAKVTDPAPDFLERQPRGVPEHYLGEEPAESAEFVGRPIFQSADPSGRLCSTGADGRQS